MVRPDLVRDHLANERTHLAYVRTSIALVGFGISINRLSAYLAAEKEATRALRGIHMGLPQAGNFGLGLAVVGLGLLLWSAIRYSRVMRAIDAGDYRPDARSIWVLTVVFLVLGAGSLASLFW